MKKVLWLIGLLLLIQIINAETTPLTIYSDKEFLGKNNWKFTSYSIPQYYFNDLNKLNKIDSNFVNSIGNWDYNVTKGLYQLGVKNDGTIGFRKNNKGLTMQLKGIGYYNKTTKQYGMVVGLDLSNPTKTENTISWNLPLSANYSIVYENKKTRDIIIMTQQVKNYLIASKPQNWNEEDIYFGLVYDLNAHNINLNNFDTNERINFLDENKSIFVLPSAKVYHENHYSGEGYVDNTGLEWIKHRVYFNGHYIEAIPFSALQSEQGFLKWNATIQLNLIHSHDDARETILGIDLTNNEFDFDLVSSGLEAGIIFQEIDIPQATTISEALLTVSFIPTCLGAGNCSLNWYGSDTDDIATWSATHKPGDEPKTTATTNHSNSTNFTPNGTFASTDLNVTEITQEILNRVGWIQDNNLGLIINYDSFGRTTHLKYKTYDFSSTSWSLSIEYEGAAPNPCQPNLNELWSLTQTLYCYNEDINLGTGNLHITSNGFLGLFASMLKGKTPFIFSAKKYWEQQYTWDSNISTDSGGISNIQHNDDIPANLLYHSGSASIWISTNNSNDHWVEIDLGETHKCLNVLFPIFYSFNWFTDINASYYDGSNWHTIYENNNFQTTDCNELWNDGSVYLCDLNLNINDNCQKVRYQVEHDSKEAGATHNLNSALGMNNIVIYDKTPPRTVLTVFDSNFQIRIEGA